MKNKFFRAAYGAMLAAILAFPLLLTGCGSKTPESGAPSGKSAEGSEPQTVSSNSEESKSEDFKWEEATGRFQYDENKLYFHGKPAVEEEQALAEGKTLLTLRAHLSNSWLKYAIDGFNRQSANFFIRLEDNQGSAEEELVLVEILAGRGPDIISGNVFDVTESLLKKEILLDLAPGLDALGITNEEYFYTFKALRMGDKVYGIRTSLSPYGKWIRKSVLGGDEQPDIETLVEKLYTYPDQEAVWEAYARPDQILEYLLSGSEDLWGMIDWENGNCDFTGQLFTKILEIAKRYQDPKAKTRESEEKWLCSSYDPFWKSRKLLESEGKVIINYPFDDGNYPAYYRMGDMLMVNSNSKNQEGVWEFLEYLLCTEEGQGYTASSSSLAASKDMTQSAFQYYLKLLEEGKMETSSEYSKEVIDEYISFAEQAHDIPLGTKEILAIIYEEAQPYCDGDKSLEEVCGLIQSRVWLYISENM